MTSEITEQRAALQAAWAGQTLCDALAGTAEQFGDLPAYSDRETAGPVADDHLGADQRAGARRWRAGFAELGLQPGDKVALMLPNRLEHVLADLGVLHAGGVPVTFYATLAPDQIAFMAANCDAKIAVIDGAERARPLAAGAVPSCRRCAGSSSGTRPRARPRRRYMSWHDFATLGAQRLAEDPGPGPAPGRGHQGRTDPVTLLYTSGTTGNPKGVIITHANALYEVETATSGRQRAPARRAGFPTCRLRTSRSGCSRCTSRSATRTTPTSATTRRRS